MESNNTILGYDRELNSETDNIEYSDNYFLWIKYEQENEYQ